MKLINTLVLNLVLVLVLITAPALAGGKHHHSPPPSESNNENNYGGNNHNAIAIALVIGAGVCIYYKCWKSKEDATLATPDLEEINQLRIGTTPYENKP